MDVASIVLEYLKVLAWPLVVVAGLVMFRVTLNDKLRDLSSAKTPVGEASFFDRRAQELAAEAAAAEVALPQELQADQPGEPDVEEVIYPAESVRGSIPPWVEYAIPRLARAGAIGGAFVAAEADPAAAVRTAYQDLIDVAYGSLAIKQLDVPSEGMGITAVLNALDDDVLIEFLPVARDLESLYSQARRGSVQSISTDGARDFIRVAMNLTRPLASLALSRTRHPSRFLAVGDTDEARAAVWAALETLSSMLREDD